MRGQLYENQQESVNVNSERGDSNLKLPLLTTFPQPDFAIPMFEF